ncbi:hypothetical protein [Pararhizobium sp. PWRC1-1]|uniref:hypothetical protein n=1 Tax=Pararhizobium sp. PWRC1-1 TaxID=2804566 RepID=UPI003CF6430E
MRRAPGLSSLRDESKRHFLLAQDGVESPYMADSVKAAAETLAMNVTVPDQANLSGLALPLFSTFPVETLEARAREVGGDLPLAEPSCGANETSAGLPTGTSILRGGHNTGRFVE